MKKDKKQVRTYCMAWILIAVLLLLIVGGVFAVPEMKNCSGTQKTVSAVKNGILPTSNVRVDSDEDTNYYLFFPWEDKVFYYFGGRSVSLLLKKAGARFWKRSETAVTLTVRFDDIKYYRTEEDKELGVNGLSVLLYANSYFSVPAQAWGNRRFVCHGSNYAGVYANSPKDIKVNIRESYYRVFKDYYDAHGDFGRLTIGIYVDGDGIPLVDFNGASGDTSAGLYLKEGVREPNDTDIGDNGGVDVGGGKGTPEKGFFEWLLDFFKGVWNFFKKYWKWILIGIVVIIVIGLIIRLVKWLRGK